MNYCPECNASWIGEEIPDGIKEYYYGTHWRREIHIEVPEIYDGTCAVKCPDCNEIFPVGDHPVFMELYEKYEKYILYKGRD